MVDIVGTYGGLAGVGPDTTEGGVAGHGAAERSLGDAGDGHCDVVCVCGEGIWEMRERLRDKVYERPRDLEWNAGAGELRW